MKKNEKGTGMRLIQFVYIVFLWGLPILLTWRSFSKMEEEKRREIIKEMKEPLFILGIAPVTIGLLVFFTGSISAPGIKVLQHSGIGFVFFGWCVMWVEELVNRNKSTVKGIAMIAIGIFGVVAYIFLF
ncbi:hypothetical protein MKY34_17560 [Sporosarcina sp. FSL K6-1522]|uniref:hypothetical protein n=1 Tax=Sporosarcina sp. FSL K6-1522 TaxID=2921554 RepID=UPI003159C192